MKILFLCGSAEPGKDGVGDYTRRLAGELIRQGNQAQILSLCDKQVTGFLTQTQAVEETSVTVRRIPVASSYKQRLAWTQKVIKEVSPDWISLQFVVYSFNAKGLPLWLPFFLKNIKGDYKRHVMFHELWVGRGKNASLKFKFLSFLQQFIIKRLIIISRTQLIHTSLPILKKRILGLVKNKYVYDLPIFSNIPFVANNNKLNSNSVFTISFFSQISYKSEYSIFIGKIAIEANKNGYDSVRLLIIGGNLEKMRIFGDRYIADNKFIDTIEYTGYIDEKLISLKLQESNIGISPIQLHAIGKSGSAAAFLSHGVPVVVLNYEDKDEEIGFFSDEIKKAIILNPKWLEYTIASHHVKNIKDILDIKQIVDKFIHDLNI
jgi:glycosyltransferase involved in cell wall biosynthesis